MHQWINKRSYIHSTFRGLGLMSGIEEKETQDLVTTPALKALTPQFVTDVANTVVLQNDQCSHSTIKDKRSTERGILTSSVMGLSVPESYRPEWSLERGTDRRGRRKAAGERRRKRQSSGREEAWCALTSGIPDDKLLVLRIKLPQLIPSLMQSPENTLPAFCPTHRTVVSRQIKSLCVKIMCIV